jgi:predicted ATPase
LAARFPDGVWLVELAPVGDPALVPDVVATTLGVTPQAGMTVTAAVTRALSGRTLMVVLDNCEHVLGGAGDLVEAILAVTTVTVLATSREGLGVATEQLWPVPSMAIIEGATSEAVALYVERARGVRPGFRLDSAGDRDAVIEICRRVDGVPLAIELAAARMMSMSPSDVNDRLRDRFRLLTGSRRGLERHQTLRNTVRWSYDLLDDDDRLVLDRCSVFAGGFDLAAACHLSDDRLDDYQVMDRLDSLVRKSLVVAEPAAGHVRYTMLETIRQFAEEQLAASGTINDVRRRHAGYYAGQAVAYWDYWITPRQPVALDWVEAEYSNLRTAFRWAADQDDLVTAAAVAAHTALLGVLVLRLEALRWVTEILDAAAAAEVPQLPRLYGAACYCVFLGQIETAVVHAHSALALVTDPRYDPFEPALTYSFAAVALALAGRVEEALRIAASLIGGPGAANAVGLSAMLLWLPSVGRVDEARALADRALSANRGLANPGMITNTLIGYGRAYADTDPTRALEVLHEGIAYSREHRLGWAEALLCQEAGSVEAVHGDSRQALELLDNAIDMFHRAGDAGNLAIAFGHLTLLFDRLQKPEIAATLYGASRRHGAIDWVIHLDDVSEHVRAVLGDITFDHCAETGAAMEVGDAATYARSQIQLIDAPATKRGRPTPASTARSGRVRPTNDRST